MKARLLAGLLPAALLVVVACTSDPEDTPVPPTEAPSPTAVITPTSTAQPTATSTVPPSADITPGGILRLAVRQAPPHQDVHQSTSESIASWGAGLAYSRLFQVQRGSNVPMPSRIPECDLCTSWKQTGPLTFEFQIRDDALWPDIPPLNGRSVTAHDIAYSYDRLTTQGWANAELLSTVESVVAISDDRLQITLLTPDAELFEKLADGRAVIVAREVVELNGDLLDGPTLGSGPWILEEIHSGGAAIEANRNYYGSGPQVDGLSIQFVPEASTRAAGVRADILDFADTSRAEVQSAIERFPNLQTVSIARPSSGVEFALNTSRSPLDSSTVRAAVFLAWDPQSEIAAIWDDGLGASAGLQLPDPNWQVDFSSEYADMFNDPAAARELLSSAGDLGDSTLTIRVGQFGAASDENRYVEIAESIAAALNGVGLSTSVEAVSTRFFADEVWLNGDYDIFIGAPPPIASLNSQLFSIYHSDGPWNTTGFADDGLDALIEEQAAELDRARRGELLRQVQNRIMAGRQRFFPAVAAEHWLWQPRVRDIYPDTSGANSDFLRHIWLKSQ